VNKKALTAVFITMLLFSVLIGVQFINKAKAETLGPIVMWYQGIPSANDVVISSPINGIYNVSSILLNFTVEALGGIYDVGYSLDDGVVERITNLTKTSETGSIPYVTYTVKGNVLLSNLSSGNHSVTVYQGYQYRPPANERFEVYAYSFVNFTVDVIPPSVLILSPEPKVYNVSDILLNFTVDEPVSQLIYSLDGQKNVTIAGNTTLENMPYGEHNVTIYATDNVGNIGSETINFTIAEPPEPFPTALVVASIVSVALIGIGLLVYFKKRKH
jgi:hypothetical protein